MEGSGVEDALRTQQRYYDLYAPHYLRSMPARDVGPGVLELPDATAVVDALRPTGAVLELACGSGVFTERLARHADTVTAIDASEAMLARNRIEVARPNVRYVQADLFDWRPDRTYDLVFFGFWLSHVPPARFARSGRSFAPASPTVGASGSSTRTTSARTGTTCGSSTACRWRRGRCPTGARSTS